MYTELKSYQIIIALLKKYGIRHCVLSAGSRNVPFVHSVEEDPYFKCYSVVDERSAGYFALGLAQELNEPVVISCTSSTATCNYWPPVAEAFYQNVPVIVLTSDRDHAMLGQLEDQMIDQVGMYDRHVKKSVNLPVVKDEDDFIYCQRLVNEALLATLHFERGPVHINIPMKSYNGSFNISKLPKVTKIERINIFDEKLWVEKIEMLKRVKKVMVIAGQNSFVSEELQSLINKFFIKYNSAIIVEYMSNIHGDGVINTSLSMDYRYITAKKFEEFIPDILITFGGNIMSGIKDLLRKFYGKYDHWLVKPTGEVVDAFKSLNTIFECSPEYFFKKFVDDAGDSKNKYVYFTKIKEYNDSAIFNNIAYSNVYAIKNMVERIPNSSILHLAINSAIRITNFSELNEGVKVYANIGTHGIDGCLSSMVGQSVAAPNKLTYLVIGDLAFFYDMNALKIRHLGKNIRILLINNHGGEEFYYNGQYINEASDLHTTARHNTKAEGWVNECGFKYLKATDKNSFDKSLPVFMAEVSDKPIFLEVFTEMKNDKDVLYSLYDLTRPKDLKNETIRKSKGFIKKTIGEEKAKKFAKFIK